MSAPLTAPELSSLIEYYSASSRDPMDVMVVRALRSATGAEVRFRELLNRACDLLDGARSGYIAGSGKDEQFRRERDELLSEAREALAGEDVGA